MAHCIVPEAENILDKEFPVLDKGFVRLVDYLGSDQRIVQSARVSYAGGTKTYRRDKGLIDYLLRNDHTSPFEQVNFTFHIKMPIFVARQWIRHRTARVNEISGRYSVMSDECYIPEGSAVALQSEDNKQGRSPEFVSAELQGKVLQLLTDEQQRSYKSYQDLLEMGIARELSRINLPLSLYTQWYWQMDLHNLFHFLRLRMDAHAQYEIRVYAEQIFELIKAVCPIACEAFENHQLKGVQLSGREKDALKQMLKGEENSLNGRENEILRQKMGINEFQKD
ncbi:MAG: FAD-dependent thymidylate synthase [Spirochaetales bacterium]|jgi:thymidylate synthase (FAD)|nr:FAD-dependent thymidylate synthase [Spirochaetales bacterium]